MSDDYWIKRKEQRMIEVLNDTRVASQDIMNVYASYSNYLNDEIDKIFIKYKTKHGLSEVEARKLLNSLPDSARYRDLLNGLAIGTEDKKELLKILDTPAYAYRINRLEIIQDEIDEMMAKLGATEVSKNKSHYISTAYDTYNKGIYDIQRMSELAFSFNALEPTSVDKMLKANWSGKNFSDRIWKNKEDLDKVLKEELMLGVLTGKTSREMREVLTDKFRVGAYEADRLIRTESNFIANQSDMESYTECGIDEYIFVATLDLRTSSACQKLDLKKYKVKEKEVGTNCPPMHPNCRSSTVAGLDAEVLLAIGRRARDPKTGKTYRVKGNQSYDQWIKEQESKYGKDNLEIFKKKTLNLKSDRKQYDRYANTLGKEHMPKTLAEFQKLKYNNVEEWEVKKREYSTINSIENKSWSDNYKTKVKNIYYDFRKEGIEVSSHVAQRFVQRNKDKDGTLNFTLQDIVHLFNTKPNYIQPDGRLVNYDNDLFIARNPNTQEIVSLNTRKHKKKEWKNYV